MTLTEKIEKALDYFPTTKLCDFVERKFGFPLSEWRAEQRIFIKIVYAIPLVPAIGIVKSALNHNLTMAEVMVGSVAALYLGYAITAYAARNALRANANPA